ncbi:hypothetical protein D3C78_1897950 [compost metagenome]
MACNSPSGTVLSASANSQISAISNTPRSTCHSGTFEFSAWRNGACRITSTSEKAAKPQ